MSPSGCAIPQASVSYSWKASHGAAAGSNGRNQHESSAFPPSPCDSVVEQPDGCTPERRRGTHMTTRSSAEFHIAWRAVSTPEGGYVTIRVTPTRSKKTNRCKVLA